MQFPPAVWGPIFWMTIHITALGYSAKPTYAEKRAAKEFYESLQFLLPCPVCREHYAQHIAEKPISPFLDSRDALFKWTVELHNKVNEKLGKPKLTEGEALYYIRRLGERKRNPLWSSSDMQEVDSASFTRGLIAGGVGVGIVGAALLFSSRL